MNYLIDTNVLSELRRPQPEREVAIWFGRHERRSLYLSVLTLGEIRKGIAKLAPGSRRDALDGWLAQDLSLFLEPRVGDRRRRRRRMGTPMRPCAAPLASNRRPAGRHRASPWHGTGDPQRPGLRRPGPGGGQPLVIGMKARIPNDTVHAGGDSALVAPPAGPKRRGWRRKVVALSWPCRRTNGPLAPKSGRYSQRGMTTC